MDASSSVLSEIAELSKLRQEAKAKRGDHADQSSAATSPTTGANTPLSIDLPAPSLKIEGFPNGGHPFSRSMDMTHGPLFRSVSSDKLLGSHKRSSDLLDSPSEVKLRRVDSHPTGFPSFHKDETATDLVKTPESTDSGQDHKVSQQNAPASDVDRMMLLVQARDGASKHQPEFLPGEVTFQCTVPGCGKYFKQRAHLHTHMRSHSGERPYACPFDDCRKLFSQRCNLRTHIRSHTGERPYKCSVCGRAFSQQGNMRHHELIHYNDHPLECKLDHCNKTFNQLGNLKAHHNAAHKQLVTNFAARLASGASREDLPQHEREMFDYFCELYKNSNRGIRGRGKGTKTIAVREPASPAPRGVSSPSPGASNQRQREEQHLQQQQQDHHKHQMTPFIAYSGEDNPSRTESQQPPLSYGSFPDPVQFAHQSVVRPSEYPNPAMVMYQQQQMMDPSKYVSPPFQQVSSNGMVLPPQSNFMPMPPMDATSHLPSVHQLMPDQSFPSYP